MNATETVEYINHSRDTLQFLYFHLWPNGYSNNKTDLADQLLRVQGKVRLFNDPVLNGYIDSLDFKVDDRRARWSLLPGSPDICMVHLNSPLLAGDTIMITTPFHVKIPEGVSSRLGHIGESYQISQWYPKPAVYDRNGWHQMPYLDQGEFYSEFGTFEVNITLPENYTVGATGNLRNEQEMDRLNRMAADTAWMNAAGKENLAFPLSSPQMKTLRYTQNNIHDFAWFADKRFHVLRGSVKLPESGREVTTWALFTDQEARYWKDAIGFENNAIHTFSKWIGDYPYTNFTAVQGALSAGLGMEYPGITLIGMVGDSYSLDQVIAHEACHNWYYSAIGSNERRYPYLDESITTACEIRYLKERYDDERLWEGLFRNKKLAAFFHTDSIPEIRIQELGWLIQSRGNIEQPINLASPDYSALNYDLIIYYKAAKGFNYLRAYLGDSLFDSAMHDYYRQWKFRHPEPEDLRMILESHTGKNLDWFFKDFINTTKHIDYKIVSYNNQELVVRNAGALASPFVVAGVNRDSICFEKWVDGFDGQTVIDIPDGNYTEIKIDPRQLIPEVYTLNNNIRTSGLFPKSDPLRMQFLFGVENPDKRTLLYIPAINWNRENGIMVGVALHNGSVLPKPVEFLIIPFVSLKKPGLAGFGSISWSLTPYNSSIRQAKIILEITQFGAPGGQNFNKIRFGSDIHLSNRGRSEGLNQMVFAYYIGASDLGQIKMGEKADLRSYLQVGYRLDKGGLINPFSLTTQAESSRYYQKASITGQYKVSYSGKNNGLDVRLYMGIMLNNNSGAPYYGLSASGRSGPDDYLYDGTFPDRFAVFPKNFWSRQLTFSEGGLVTPVNKNSGYGRWLLSVSLSGNLPGKASRIPIKPFANLVMCDSGTENVNPTAFYWEAGLKAGLWGIFEIYLPLIASDNLPFYQGKFKDRIRFLFNLDPLSSGKL